MFDAQLLIAASTVYSPWFPREGDSARFTIDVIEIFSAEITVKAFTKNSNDAGDGSNADSSTSIVETSTGRSTVEWASTSSTGFKELVRYEFDCAVDAVLPPGEKAWALFRMLQPVWFDMVKA